MGPGKLIRPVEVLLVEDDPGEARLIKEALKEGKIPLHLSVVEDGEAALAFLRREGAYAQAARPHLILLSLKLPRKDGHTMLADMKSDPALRAIPVVVLTSSEAKQDVLRSYALHANCYVLKPVDLEQLLTVVRAIEEFWFTVVTLPA
jgi:chemotaxis family two-component system response regulator Rcp1